MIAPHDSHSEPCGCCFARWLLAFIFFMMMLGGLVILPPENPPSEPSLSWSLSSLLFIGGYAGLLLVLVATRLAARAN